MTDWVEEAKRACFYLELANFLRSESKKSKPKQATVAELLEATRLNTPLQSDSIHYATGDDRRFLAITMQSVQNDALLEPLFSADTISNYRKQQNFSLSAFQAMNVGRDYMSIAWFKKRMQQHFWSIFQERAIFSLHGDRFIFRQGCDVQIYRELSEAFSGNIRLKSCKHCGMIFFPRTGKQDYCDLSRTSRCRVAYHQSRRPENPQ